MTPAPPAALSLPRLMLAVAIVAVWGTNFVVIRMGLNHLPPLLFAALRFTGVFLPAALFIKRPKVSWRDLALYGGFIGAGQFGLMFMAIRSDITPGLASLVIQIQVFFTVGLAMRTHGERVRPYQMISLGLAAAGLVLIAARAGGAATPLGLALILGASLCWAIGNTVARRSPDADMLAYVVWGSLFSMLPLYAMSLIFEGWDAIRDGVMRADAATWAAVAWQSVGNSLFGYAAWGWLLARHPAGVVAPMALLVPVFGMGASALFLGEPLQFWKLLAAALVLGGLAFNLLWPRVRGRFA